MQNIQIQVIKAGLHDSFQDLGRVGFRHLGIPVSGAMDKDAHRLANELVGNPIDYPTLEMALKGGIYQFQNDALIAITGGDFLPKINGNLAPCNESFFIKKGDILKMGFTQNGSKVYLAVQGLAKLQRHFNSYSTYTYGKFGGFDGRILKKGDVIFFENDNLKVKKRKANAASLPIFQALTTIRIMKSVEWDYLKKDSQQQLTEQIFKISNDSNRMGIRLSALPLASIKKEKMVSSGTALGTLQLLPSGQLIVLMNDGQTTGGYPRIGNVITADLGRLSQVLPNGEIKFRLVDEAEALQVLTYKSKRIGTETI